MTAVEHTQISEEPVRLGVDFGVSTTIITVGDPAGGFPTLDLEDISHIVPGIPGKNGVYLVPSLIRYEEGCVAGIGDEVLRTGREQEASTARSMRRYLFDNSPVQVSTGNGHMIRCGVAAAEFLTIVLSRAVGQYPGGANMVFALPADASTDYPAWLERISRAAGARSCSWVNEFLAAALGYGVYPQAGKPFLVISFAETELTVTVVIVVEPGTGHEWECVRMAGRASIPTGCQVVDAWIVQDLLTRFRMLESNPREERIRPLLFREARRARERIPFEGMAEITVTEPVGGRTYTAHYGPEELTRVLDGHGVIQSVRDVLDRALSALRAQGQEETRIASVLLIGPGCTLPGVAESVRDRFPGITVHVGHEMDAVARGAAAFAEPARAPDRITNSYALRYWDPSAQEHRYRFLVHSGTRFPSEGQIARITISAAYDGQTHLGIPLFEIAGNKDRECAIELVSDTAGGVRLAGPTEDAGATVQAVPVNDRNIPLLIAEPPAKKGEPRFECTFVIDRERYLCLSARDLATGTLVKLNRQVYRLT